MAEQKFTHRIAPHSEQQIAKGPNLAGEHQRGDKQDLRERLRQEGARIAQARHIQKLSEPTRKDTSKDQMGNSQGLAFAPSEDEDLRRRNRNVRTHQEIIERTESERQKKIEAAAFTARTSISLVINPHVALQSPEVQQAKSTSGSSPKIVLSEERNRHFLNSDPFRSPQTQTTDQLKLSQPLFTPATSAVSERRYALTHGANDLYQAMRGGATGIGTDENKIFRTLEGKDPIAVREMRQIYFDHYGRELERDLKAELKSDKRFMARLAPLLEGDALKADVAGVRLQIELPLHDKKEIIRIIAAQSPESLPKFIDFYRAQYGSDLSRDLAPILNSHEEKGVEALLKGERDVFEVYQIRTLLEDPKANIEELEVILNDLHGPRLEKAEQLYQAKFNESMLETISPKLEGATLERVTAILANDPAKVNAIKIHELLLQSDTPLLQIQNLIRNLSADERRHIFAIYQSHYGNSLLTDLKQKTELDPIKNNIAEKLVQGLQISEAEELAVVVTELLPKDKLVRAQQHIEQVIFDKTRDQITQLGHQLKVVTGEDLNSIVQSRFKGVQKFDLGLALLGKPESLDEEHRRAYARYEYERMKLNAPGARVLDILSEQGQILDTTAKRVTEQHRRLTRVDSALDEANEMRFYGLLDFLDHDVRNYRNAKGALARLISNSSALLMGAFGFFVSARSGYGSIESLATAALFGGITKAVVSSYLSTRTLSGDGIIEELKHYKPKKGSRASRRARRAPLKAREALPRRKSLRRRP